ncbi:hypothetical protein ACFU99_44660, partial [Streptomyces sp. NPDC057654]
MGLFRRKSRRTGAETEAEAAVAAASPVSAASTASPVEAQDGGWAAVPPVQRVLDAVNPVVETRFTTSLAAHRDPSFGGELGHDVRASAPGGTIGGVISRATAAPSAGGGGGSVLPALPVLPVAPRGRTDGPVAPELPEPRT